MVKCDASTFASFGELGSPQQLAALGSRFKVDAVLTIPAAEQQLRSLLHNDCELISIEDVSESQYERTRLRLLSNTDPVDKLPASTLEELIGRSVKFTTTLRFFDYLMAKSGSSARKCRAGIQFFTTIWSRWCVLESTTPLSIELFSVAGRQSAAGFLDVTEANCNLASMITCVEQIARVKARAFLKRDDNKIFHTRGIESRGRAYTLDPGFDSFDENGPTRRCLLKLELAAEVQFRECRQLPEA